MREREGETAPLVGSFPDAVNVEPHTLGPVLPCSNTHTVCEHSERIRKRMSAEIRLDGRDKTSCTAASYKITLRGRKSLNQHGV